MSPVSAVKLLWTLLVAIPLVAGRADTPEGAISAFVDAWNGRDIAKAAKYVVGGKPGANFTETEKILPPMMKITVTDLKVTTNGDKATANFQMRLEANNEKPIEQAESAELVRVNGEWLLVPTGMNNSGRDVLGSLAMMTTMDMTEVFAKAKEAAKKTACLSNIKQLALGVMMYLADNDDKFSMNSSKLKATLNPYTKNDRLWFCPATDRTKVAYSINPNLLNKRADQLTDPANTVLLYEGSKGQLDFRHTGGMAAVAFADGHAKMITAEAAKKLRWKP